ncbi:MAG: sigma-70 family RNA polymerase sigma factor [Vicinamibacterales bacterium]
MVRKFESLASESETLHAYLREISSFPLLSRDDEQHLGRQIQQHGDEDALGRLVQSNLRFVVQYAKRFRRLGVPLLDLIHEGNLGLIEAARRFDPAQVQTFQASALWWIRQAMMHLLAEASRTSDVNASGLQAAAVAGRQVEAIRVALEYAHSTAAGGDVREPATSDVEDLEAHLQNEGRKRRKARKASQGPLKVEAGTLHALRQHSVLRSYLN